MGETSGSERLGELIGSGRTAQVYRWGPGQIVKLFSPATSADLAEQEARLADALTGMGVPAPRYDGRIQVDDRDGLLFEWLGARSMLQALIDRPWRVLSLARQLADIHVAIHQRVADQVFPSQREVTRAAIMAAPGLPDCAREHALRQLSALPNGERLCHGDFHPDNVLLTGGEPVVIDWMTATRGCPAADVARTLLILRHGELPPGTGRITVVKARGLRRLFAWAYWHRYRRRSDVRDADLEGWRVPLMAARLREGIPADEREQLLSWLDATETG